jgi:antitoxin (DNA-binding transcriptional repressor) of toxin-antitoxin stability system
MGRPPTGFSYQVRAGGEVQISHHGRPATVLRGNQAQDFLADVERVNAQGEDAQGEDAQLLMARVTGQYRHGNERTARNHPRNRRAR